MLLPVSLIGRAELGHPSCPLSLLSSAVRAGFPARKMTTWIMISICRMRSGILLQPTSGNSMIGGKIHHGDLLVVNGSRVIVIAVDRDLAVKRLERAHQRAYLRANNQAYRSIPLEGRPIGVLSKTIAVLSPALMS